MRRSVTIPSYRRSMNARLGSFVFQPYFSKGSDGLGNFGFLTLRLLGYGGFDHVGRTGSTSSALVFENLRETGERSYFASSFSRGLG